MALRSRRISIMHEAYQIDGNITLDTLMTIVSMILGGLHHPHERWWPE
jgi:hypothetical protein